MHRPGARGTLRAMATSSGAQLLARMLKAEGVRHLFTLCGLHIAPIYAACVEEGIAIVDTRHEQAATHAADAYARLTRGVGVVAVTAGPGVTDALTGVANAYAASSPVLLLGGAAPTFNAGRGSLQEMEQVDLFTRITKWSDRIPAPSAGAERPRVRLPRRAPPRASRAPGDHRGKLDLVGRRPGSARAASRPDRGARVPEWRRPGIAATRAPEFLHSHPQGRALRGRRGGGRGNAARFPARLRRGVLAGCQDRPD